MKGFPVRHWARIYNTPLLILPAALEAMLPGVEQALRREDFELVPEALVTLAQERADQSGLRVERGVAVIPIYGPLVHRGRYDAECNRILGYQDLAMAFQAALADPQVHSIVAVFDTPGGEVAACFDTAAMIGEAAKRKPVHAAVSEQACSAGYALASACSSISITQTAIAGSVGVYCRHVSMEAWLKKEGYVVTEFFAGDHKTDGTPYKDIPKDVASRIQARIDTLYGMFVALVATGRGLSEEAVTSTNADIFMGEEALAMGFADRLETPDELISRLATSAMSSSVFLPADFGAASTPNEATPMNPVPEALCTSLGLPADASEAQAVSQVQKIAATAAQAEAARIFGILSIPEAKGHEQQAVALAKVPAMSADTAKEVLAAMPTQIVGKAIADNQFANLMTKLGNPDVGADPEMSDEEEELVTARKGWATAFTGGETR
jgi:signal peptide peptidase SppA